MINPTKHTGGMPSAALPTHHNVLNKIISVENPWKPHQKEIIKGRIKEITGYAQQNIGSRNQDQLINEINAMLVSVGSPLNLPECDMSSECRILFELLFKEAPKFTDLIKKSELMKCALIKKNEPLLKEFRGIINKLFEEICSQMQQQPPHPSVEALIGHLLSYYPLLSPKDGEMLRIPIMDNGQWKLVPYTIGSISMTPRWLGTTHNAITLTPQVTNVPPMVIFKATSYPSEDGFLMTALSDFNPFASVGKYCFTYSKKKIKDWLKNTTETGHHKARIFGVSLGGALGQHAAVNFPSLIESAHLYCSPALWPNDMKKWDKAREKPKLKIYNQDGGDPVPWAGFQWPKGVELYKVIGDKKRTRPSTTHIRCHANDEAHIILKMDPEKDVNRIARKIFAIFHAVVSIPVFITGCLLLLASLTVQGIIHVIEKIKNVKRESLKGNSFQRFFKVTTN